MLVFFNQVIGGAKHLAGGEKTIVELIRRWKRFIEITVVIPENGIDLLQTKEKLDIKYISLPLTFLDKNSLYWKYTFLIPVIWFIHTVRSCRKTLNINIEDKKIFSSGDFFCNIIPAFLLKIRDKEIDWIVSIFHIIDSPLRREGGFSFFSNTASYIFQNFSFWLIRKRADIIFVLNKDVENSLIKMGFDEKKLYILGAGIDFGNIDAIAPDDDTVYDACFMARLSATKGIFYLPKIWEEVSRKIKKVKLLIIGTGLQKDMAKLNYLISEANLNGRIEMVGFKDEAVKYALMKSSKIFIFPSYEEGFAISILEAIACKLPVIAWDLPVYKSVYKDTIITVPKGNVARFVKEILNLLSDEKLRILRAERAYNFARQYDWDFVASKAYERINGTKVFSQKT